MTQAQAVKIATKAIEAQMKSLAVEANLFDLYKLDTPGTVKASQKRAELREALKVLKNFQGNLL